MFYILNAILGKNDIFTFLNDIFTKNDKCTFILAYINVILVLDRSGFFNELMIQSQTRF